jgi:hypothetical protein
VNNPVPFLNELNDAARGDVLSKIAKCSADQCVLCLRWAPRGSAGAAEMLAAALGIKPPGNPDGVSIYRATLDNTLGNLLSCAAEDDAPPEILAFAQNIDRTRSSIPPDMRVLIAADFHGVATIAVNAPN